MNDHALLQRLMDTIEHRKLNRPQRSYTTRLFDGGVEKIGAKVLEEAGEVVEAAGRPGAEGRQQLIYETGDLVYHLLVLLAAREVRLSDVSAELARREGISGLDEKAARPSNEEPGDG